MRNINNLFIVYGKKGGRGVDEVEENVKRMKERAII